jgi:hypothetical protein
VTGQCPGCGEQRTLTSKRLIKAHSIPGGQLCPGTGHAPGCPKPALGPCPTPTKVRFATLEAAERRAPGDGPACDSRAGAADLRVPAGVRLVALDEPAGAAPGGVPVTRRHSPEFLAEITRQFNAHVDADWPPVRAIAVSYGVEQESAARWVRECRAAGHVLEPAGGLRHHWAGERR